MLTNKMAFEHAKSPDLFDHSLRSFLTNLRLCARCRSAILY